MKSYRTRIGGCLALALITSTAAQGAQLFGPTPYLSSADSPFAGLGFASFYLENLEDSALNTPGVSASAGIPLGPAAQTDSVDADDGVINGSGTAGHSWYIGTTNVLEFTFDPIALGGYPTHAGVVWTDVGLAFNPGSDRVSFEAFSPGGGSLGAINNQLLGDGQTTGGTAEDRFFGIADPGGIASIRITMETSQDWEVDHLQYGIVPEPATLSLAALSVLLARRRRTGR